jgi:hypothetical protein
MPPAYEVLLLNTAIPQIQAAQTGDTYVVPRDIAFSAALTLSAGTANGVPYLNASKVLTTGSALTYSGNSLTNTIPSNASLQLGLSVTNATNADFNVRIANNLTDLQVSSATPLSFTLGASEQMRLTNTGLGIGTSLPGAQLDISTTVSATGAILRLSNQSNTILVDEPHGTIQFFSGDDSSPADTVVSSIISAQATTAPNEGYLKFLTGNNTEKLRISADGTFRVKGAGTAGSTDAFQVAGTAPADAARITSGGEFLVGVTSGSGSTIQRNTDTAAATLALVSNTATTGNQYGVYNRLVGDPNNTANYFMTCIGNAAERATIRSDGGLANYQSNNVDLSDIRTKTDINPLGSYWNKIAGLEVVTYKYKDQTHDDLNIGVIAQQVEAVAPEFVDTDGFGETPEDGVPLKTIYNKDLTFAAIKALQEAMARIETLEAKIAALEAK